MAVAIVEDVFHKFSGGAHPSSPDRIAHWRNDHHRVRVAAHGAEGAHRRLVDLLAPHDRYGRYRQHVNRHQCDPSMRRALKPLLGAAASDAAIEVALRNLIARSVVTIGASGAVSYPLFAKSAEPATGNS